MITAQCSTCRAELPRRETFTVSDRILCEQCTTQFIEQYGQTMAHDDVVRNLDPTICNWCQADAGFTHHREVASLPICEPCERRLRNWPFPNWIKFAFVSLVVLGIVSFFFNLRHMQGFLSSRAAARAMKAGDLDVALERAMDASQKVPEFAQYRFGADLLEGISLIARDRNSEALIKLQRLDGEAPGNQMIKRLISRAEIAIAFDNKNYDRFLELAKQLHAADPNDRGNGLQLASANACKFAETGREEFKQAVRDQLVALGQDRSAEETEYRQRIEFRIATRRIIDQKQFKKEFPNGWKSEE